MPTVLYKDSFDSSGGGKESMYKAVIVYCITCITETHRKDPLFYNDWVTSARKFDKYYLATCDDKTMLYIIFT